MLNALTTFALVGPYRPANWGQPQLYSLTCILPANAGLPEATVTTSQTVNGQPVAGPFGSSTQPATAGMPTTYFFDAMLRAEHTQEAVGTKHPVQVGPAVIDHIYLLPARVVLEVGFSDTMQSFLAGQYSGGRSRSVNAFQAMKQVQAARVPITLATRLQTYQNMWLADVRAVEDYRTSRSGRFTLHFEQIISATVSSGNVSSRPNATDTTNVGTVAPTAPTPSTLNGVDALPN